MKQAQNTVIQAKDMVRGMVILPYSGETFKRTVESLDWTQALYKDNWQHTVLGTDDKTVTLARPYVYAHEHFDSRNPLIGCEVYTICKDSTHPYMLMKSGMLT